MTFDLEKANLKSQVCVQMTGVGPVDGLELIRILEGHWKGEIV